MTTTLPSTNLTPHTIAVMQQCTQDSIAGTMTFPEVVQRSHAIGVETYHVDLYRKEKTYYFPNGETFVEPLNIPSPTIAQAFCDQQVIAAIRAIQHQEVSYLDFLQQIAAGGTTHYYVYLQGKQAVYYGRTGDCYIEPFPGK